MPAGDLATRVERLDPGPLQPPGPGPAPQSTMDAVGIHHAWEAPLLDFTRAAALHLDPSFPATNDSHTEESEADPFERNYAVTRFGSENRGLRLTSELRWGGMGEPPESHSVTVAAYGLPAGAQLQVAFEFYADLSPTLECRCTGPDPTALATIVALFRQKFAPPAVQTKSPLELRGWVAAMCDHLERDQWQSALEVADRILAACADHPSASFGRGTALCALGRSAEGYAVLEPLCIRWPVEIDAWYNLGNACLALHRHAEAAAAYEWTLALSPCNHPAHVQHGLALERLHLPRAAADAFVTALGTGPSSPLHWQGMNREHTALDGLTRLYAKHAAATRLPADDSSAADLETARADFLNRVARAIDPAALQAATQRIGDRLLERIHGPAGAWLQQALKATDQRTRTFAQVAVLAADRARNDGADFEEYLAPVLLPKVSGTDQTVARQAQELCDRFHILVPPAPAPLPNLAEYLLKAGRRHTLRAVALEGLIAGDWSNLPAPPVKTSPTLPAALAPHLQMLADGSEPDRNQAIESLGDSADPRALPYLLRHLDEAREVQCKAILRALDRLLRALGLNEKNTPSLAHIFPEFHRDFVHPSSLIAGLAAAGPAAKAILQALATDEHLAQEDQIQVIVGLCRFDDRRSRNAIADMLGRNDHITEAAAHALGGQTDIRAVAPLVLLARQSRSPHEEVGYLTKILKQSAVGISVENLKILSELDGLVEDVYEVVSDNPMFDSHEFVGTFPVDTAEIRRLAAAELARRAGG